MKRVILFLATNIAVMLVLGVVLSLLGVNRFLAQEGLNIGMLLAFSAVVGFTGSIISLLISKPMAKWSTGAHVIEAPQTGMVVRRLLFELKFGAKIESVENGQRVGDRVLYFGRLLP